MANLQKTRERIKVVNNIKIITNAMQLVATSKMRRIARHNQTHQRYHELFMHMFDDLRSRLTKKETEELFSKNNSQNKLYIVITSDLGLSGAYNSNVFRLAKKEVSKNDYLYVFGRKGQSYFDKDKYRDQVIQNVTEIGDIIQYDHAIKAANQALAMFNDNKIGSINIIYTKFINNLTYEETIRQILPFSDVDSHNKQHQVIEFEPSEQEVLNNAIPMFIASEIYHALSESKLSETTSRRFAMENATKNASELIENLTLEYNRVRQAKITQEITEIIGGTQ